MFDQELTLEKLRNIEESIIQAMDWTSGIASVEGFISSPDGMILLNAVCMKLMAVGEEVKSLDKHTDKKLLPKYPAIPWRNVMGMRDIIAHHYFQVDASEIFNILQNDLPPLLATVKKMIADLG